MAEAIVQLIGVVMVMTMTLLHFNIWQAGLFVFAICLIQAREGDDSVWKKR
jgi:hypothetical protein